MPKSQIRELKPYGGFADSMQTLKASNEATAKLAKAAEKFARSCTWVYRAHKDHYANGSTEIKELEAFEAAVEEYQVEVLGWRDGQPPVEE